MDIRNFKIDLNMIYMGSKKKISKYILPIITNNLSKGRYYVEPFLEDVIYLRLMHPFTKRGTFK